mmetsp:Transcript_166242/g.533804  ORF Transcript_166242/g.533804 Transcript_166242/m.533804 type:complete len:301 (+) Transcript_166242:62-964(+)
MAAVAAPSPGGRAGETIPSRRSPRAHPAQRRAPPTARPEPCAAAPRTRPPQPTLKRRRATAMHRPGRSAEHERQQYGRGQPLACARKPRRRRLPARCLRWARPRPLPPPRRRDGAKRERAGAKQGGRGREARKRRAPPSRGPAADPGPPKGRRGAPPKATARPARPPPTWVPLLAKSSSKQSHRPTSAMWRPSGLPSGPRRLGRRESAIRRQGRTRHPPNSEGSRPRRGWGSARRPAPAVAPMATAAPPSAAEAAAATPLPARHRHRHRRAGPYARASWPLPPRPRCKRAATLPSPSEIA